MKEIRLTKGYVALVDDDDYDAISKYKWRVKISENTNYAITSKWINGKAVSFLMHRIIMAPLVNEWIDHVNRNGLDNRCCNLRKCNRAENRANSKDNGGTSKYKGVSWSRNMGKWRANIMINHKILHLGYFNNEKQAARVYDMVAMKHHKEFAKPNLPQEEK
jgi:hypothetical protein